MATGDCPTGATCTPIQGQGICLYPKAAVRNASPLELIPRPKVPHYVINAFEGFKTKYNREYESEEEHERRLRVFYENLRFIEDFYRSGPHPYDLGINDFADVSHEEFEAKYFGMNVKPMERELNIVHLDTTNLDDAVDWRTKGAVTPVKNQEQCGSCWAFSAVAAMEGLYFQTSGTLDSFSEQQLVDCSGSEGNQACNGGLMDYAFEYAEKHKMVLESDYAYKGRKKFSRCEASSYTGVFSPTGYTDVPPKSVDALAAASMKQVVSVAVEADKTVFQHYTGGVLDSSACGEKLDHGVTVVGYNADAWIVKNSWGPSWGDAGYL